MEMSQKDFKKALEIITSNNQITVSFNTPVKDSYSNVYQILIHESNAAVVNELKEEGFSMSMCPKGLSVTKY